MPASDSEPEKYSVDEMMDRLRSSGDGGRDGEARLVTREDGSQVYKVRKRKRRSLQPKKEKEIRQKRFRVVQIVAAAALVVLVAFAFFASLVYLNSSAYREDVLGKIRTWTGAEPKVVKLRVTPVGVSADRIELDWPEDSPIESLDLGEIKGDLSFASLIGGKWKGSELFSGGAGSLVLRPMAGKSARPVKPEGDSPFMFRYRSAKLDVRMGPEASPRFLVAGSEAELEMHDPAGSSTHLVLKGGNLNLPNWGKYDLVFASFQFEPEGMRVGNIRLSPPGAGKGEIGILNPEKVPLNLEGGDCKLEIHLDRMPIASLLGPSFGTWLNATVETPEKGEAGEMHVRTGPDAAVTCRVPFRSSATGDSVATGLPMFDILAKELDETWYETPRFDLDVKGTAVLEEDKKGIEDLLLDARGRLSISGKVFATADGKLDGELNVGIPAAGVDAGSIGLRNLFKRKGGGFAWAKVRISGTAARPMDDLAVQIKSAATQAVPAEEGDDGLEKAFEDLTTPGVR